MSTPSGVLSESPRRWPVVLGVLLVGSLLVVRLAGVRFGFLQVPVVQAWSTVFVAIVIQATPFLVLGVVVSALIATVVPASFFADALPERELLAVPMASVAGAVLPGCECASVPIAQRLVTRGVPASAALAFLLSAPAINPVVLVATAVAFPHRPEMVLARIVASVAVSMLVGFVWAKAGRPGWMKLRPRREPVGRTRFESFATEVRHDFLEAGGFLVIGAMAAATLNVVVPQQLLAVVASSPWLAIPALGLLAVVLAVCSEADAFVASSLTQFSFTAQLAFMVVGPMVDVKLVAMQVGAFGRGFAVRFAPLVFAAGIGISAVVGAVLS